MRLIIEKNNIKLNNTRLNLEEKDWPAATAFCWWDASDASSVTLLSGGTSDVVQLEDKGILKRHMIQPTATNQPTFNSVQQNGNSTISFERTNNEYLYNTGAHIEIANSIFLIAFKPKNIGSKYNAVFSYDGPNKDFQIDAGDGSYWYGRFNSANYTNNNFDTVDSLNIPQVLGFVSDKTNGILKGYKNGVEKFTITNFDGFANDNITMKFAENRNATRWMSMDFYEALISPISEKDRITEYLMDKWNIT